MIPISSGYNQVRAREANSAFTVTTAEAGSQCDVGTVQAIHAEVQATEFEIKKEVALMETDP